MPLRSLLQQAVGRDFCGPPNGQELIECQPTVSDRRGANEPWRTRPHATPRQKNQTTGMKPFLCWKTSLCPNVPGGASLKYRRMMRSMMQAALLYDSGVGWPACQP